MLRDGHHGVRTVYDTLKVSGSLFTQQSARRAPIQEIPGVDLIGVASAPLLAVVVKTREHLGARGADSTRKASLTVHGDLARGRKRRTVTNDSGALSGLRPPIRILENDSKLKLGPREKKKEAGVTQTRGICTVAAVTEGQSIYGGGRKSAGPEEVMAFATARTCDSVAQISSLELDAICLRPGPFRSGPRVWADVCAGGARRWLGLLHWLEAKSACERFA